MAWLSVIWQLNNDDLACAAGERGVRAIDISSLFRCGAAFTGA